MTHVALLGAREVGKLHQRHTLHDITLHGIASHHLTLLLGCKSGDEDVVFLLIEPFLDNSDPINRRQSTWTFISSFVDLSI